MFTHHIKVRGFHCDIFGHVNNARYLEFLEETRWEWLNSISSFNYFLKQNMSFVVVSVTIHYRYPSVLNDMLSITAVIKQMGNRSATVTQIVKRESDGKLIAEAEVTFALLDNTTGKAIQLNDELKSILTA